MWISNGKQFRSKKTASVKHLKQSKEEQQRKTVLTTHSEQGESCEGCGQRGNESPAMKDFMGYTERRAKGNH